MVTSRSGSCLLVRQYITYCVLFKFKVNSLQFIHVCIFSQFLSNISLLSFFVFVDKDYICVVCKWYRPVFFWNCGQIIDIDKKKEWSQYRPLGYAVWYHFFIRFDSVIWYALFSSIQVTYLPLFCYSPDSIFITFFHQYHMVQRIKCFTKIQWYTHYRLSPI